MYQKGGWRNQTAYGMFKVNRKIIVELKLHIWLPYGNVCMVSYCNGPLQNEVQLQVILM
jgi:hypothetical protein